jgi:hypothetical protein
MAVAGEALRRQGEVDEPPPGEAGALAEPVE